MCLQGSTAPSRELFNLKSYMPFRDSSFCLLSAGLCHVPYLYIRYPHIPNVYAVMVVNSMEIIDFSMMCQKPHMKHNEVFFSNSGLMGCAHIYPLLSGLGEQVDRKARHEVCAPHKIGQQANTLLQAWLAVLPQLPQQAAKNCFCILVISFLPQPEKIHEKFQKQ